MQDPISATQNHTRFKTYSKYDIKDVYQAYGPSQKQKQTKLKNIQHSVQNLQDLKTNGVEMTLPFNHQRQQISDSHRNLTNIRNTKSHDFTKDLES
jgi:hypothetical protein